MKTEDIVFIAVLVGTIGGGFLLGIDKVKNEHRMAEMYERQAVALEVLADWAAADYLRRSSREDARHFLLAKALGNNRPDSFSRPANGQRCGKITALRQYTTFSGATIAEMAAEEEGSKEIIQLKLAGVWKEGMRACGVPQ